MQLDAIPMFLVFSLHLSVDLTRSLLQQNSQLLTTPSPKKTGHSSIERLKNTLCVCLVYKHPFVHERPPFVGKTQHTHIFLKKKCYSFLISYILCLMRGQWWTFTARLHVSWGQKLSSRMEKKEMKLTCNERGCIWAVWIMSSRLASSCSLSKSRL